MFEWLTNLLIAGQLADATQARKKLTPSSRQVSLSWIKQN